MWSRCPRGGAGSSSSFDLREVDVGQYLLHQPCLEQVASRGQQGGGAGRDSAAECVMWLAAIERGQECGEECVTSADRV
jgi:hypothetical protein